MIAYSSRKFSNTPPHHQPWHESTFHDSTRNMTDHIMFLPWPINNTCENTRPCIKEYGYDLYIVLFTFIYCVVYIFFQDLLKFLRKTKLSWSNRGRLRCWCAGSVCSLIYQMEKCLTPTWRWNVRGISSPLIFLNSFVIKLQLDLKLVFKGNTTRPVVYPL